MGRRAADFAAGGLGRLAQCRNRAVGSCGIAMRVLDSKRRQLCLVLSPRLGRLKCPQCYPMIATLRRCLSCLVPSKLLAMARVQPQRRCSRREKAKIRVKAFLPKKRGITRLELPYSLLRLPGSFFLGPKGGRHRQKPAPYGLRTIAAAVIPVPPNAARHLMPSRRRKATRIDYNFS